MLAKLPTSTSLLSRLIATPDLVRTVRGLPENVFSALVRHVGVEDCGELVALATTEQLVAAFDEDLFANAAPGEREELDPQRFALWLEVLLEAGDEAAARRITELSEDFVVRVFSSLILVLDQDALLTRLREDESGGYAAEKALDSALAEHIEGYLLVARIYEGWDAVLSLILALDRHHRWLLVLILDRCAALSRDLAWDLDALSEVLSSTESLAEDVEAERDERRARRGFVEARSAKSFLALSRIPIDGSLAAEMRDPVTRDYLRLLEPKSDTAPGAAARATEEDSLARTLAALPAGSVLPQQDTSRGPLVSRTGEAERPQWPRNVVEGLRGLADASPERFDQRMQELAYLANALLAGAAIDGRRLRPAEASEAALATVALGAELEARPRIAEGASSASPGAGASVDELRDVLRVHPADLLFRRAASSLAECTGSKVAFVRSFDELEELLGER